MLSCGCPFGVFSQLVTTSHTLEAKDLTAPGDRVHRGGIPVLWTGPLRFLHRPKHQLCSLFPPGRNRKHGKVRTNDWPRIIFNGGIVLLILLFCVFLANIGGRGWSMRHWPLKQSTIMSIAFRGGIGQFLSDYDRLPLSLGWTPSVGDSDTDSGPLPGLVALLAGWLCHGITVLVVDINQMKAALSGAAPAGFGVW